VRTVAYDSANAMLNAFIHLDPIYRVNLRVPGTAYRTPCGSSPSHFVFPVLQPLMSSLRATLIDAFMREINMQNNVMQKETSKANKSFSQLQMLYAVFHFM